jgi:hypothetical protein
VVVFTGQFIENGYDVDQNFCATFFHGKRHVFILAKKYVDWAAFWAIFPKTNLGPMF